MYKSDQIRDFFYEISIKYILILFLIFNFFNKAWSQTSDYFNQNSDTIVVITLNSFKEVRGVLIDQNEKIISIEIANKEKVIFKEDIRTIKYISRDEIKNIKEFEKPNPIHSKYCYLPSAFITKKKIISTNSHYFLTSNSKIGISENFEISVGNIFFVNVLSSLTYSKEINNSFTGAISVIGNYNWSNNQIEIKNRFGWGFIPRITFGDKFKNTSIGFVGYQSPLIPSVSPLSLTFFYGGYFGSQKKIAEKFTIAGETLGITSDGFQYFVVTNLILNYRRSFRENWSAGLTLLSTNSNDIQSVIGTNNGAVLPLPYLGIQRSF